MILFNKPLFLGTELEYVKEAVLNNKICGDGIFTSRCNSWLEEKTGACKALLTTSCTHAIEMAALLTGIGPGDEVIMPSFTFVSTANAFVLRGAKIVFVDIRPDTMNIDENKIEQAITSRTRAIVPVHYAGVACEMDYIMKIAKQYNLYVIEDAAQGIMSSYKGRMLGTIGDFGCYSFHETKNYTMGEGGALLVKNQGDVEKAEIIREKGTNRCKFFRKEIDKYTWTDKGSSYLPSDINAAYLWAQLLQADHVNKERLTIWQLYYNMLEPVAKKGFIELPHVPLECIHNGHMFYIKVKDLSEQQKMIEYLKQNGVGAVFHYIPLHNSSAGKIYSIFSGEDKYTTKESERLIRLPMYYGLAKNDVETAVQVIASFYKCKI